MGEGSDLSESLKALSEEHRELYGSNVEVMHDPPEALHFYRSFVSQNRPCLIQGAIESWRARTAWNLDYFRNTFAGCEITVAATPDGMADAAARLPETGEEVFALPAEGIISMAALLHSLTCSGDRKGRGNVLYMQQQDDCLRKVFSKVLPDIQPMLPWADQAFGVQPEAVNLWIGNQASRTSFHKDPYENIFVVIQGSKTFHLLPPCDYYRLRTKAMPVAQYSLQDPSQDISSEPLKLEKQNNDATIKWSSVQPEMKSEGSARQYPGLEPSKPCPVLVTVRPGEALFLPSLWHHFVEQDVDSEGVCIAVNFWYDMTVDAKVVYYNFVERLGDLCKE